jgi:hypothetical protein
MPQVSVTWTVVAFVGCTPPYILRHVGAGCRCGSSCGAGDEVAFLPAHVVEDFVRLVQDLDDVGDVRRRDRSPSRGRGASGWSP